MTWLHRCGLPPDLSGWGGRVWPSPNPDVGERHGPAVTGSMGLGVWEFGGAVEKRGAILMATIPLLPNFLPMSSPVGQMQALCIWHAGQKLSTPGLK